MIVVNVTPTYRRSLSYDEVTSLIRGDWPVRQQEDLTSYADLLVGVARSRIAAVRKIDRIEVMQVEPRRRVRCDLSPWPEAEAAVGRPSPEAFRWRPGEHWPVKTLRWGIDDFCDALGIGQSVSQVSLEGFSLTVEPSGKAELWCPAGATVTIHV